MTVAIVPTNARQAMFTLKARALVVVFSIYDPTKTCSSKYRQVGAPKDGGIRHTSVRKNIEKDELMEWTALVLWTNSIFQQISMACNLYTTWSSAYDENTQGVTYWPKNSIMTVLDLSDWPLSNNMEHHTN